MNEIRDAEVFTPEQLTEIEAMETDSEGFVRIGEISNGFLGRQSQYIGRYFHGKIDGFPKLVNNLRYEGQENNYHSWKLAKEDVKTFIIRVRSHLWSVGHDCR